MFDVYNMLCSLYTLIYDSIAVLWASQLVVGTSNDLGQTFGMDIFGGIFNQKRNLSKK